MLTTPVELKTNERLFRVRIALGEDSPFEFVTRGEIRKLSGFSECLRRMLIGCMRKEVVISKREREREGKRMINAIKG